MKTRGIFSSLVKILKGIFPEPAPDTGLVEEVQIRRAGLWLTVECRKDQNGYFGVIRIRGGGEISTVHLEHSEFGELVEGLSKFKRDHLDQTAAERPNFDGPWG